MARLIKHRVDIKEYLEKLESQYNLVSFQPCGSNAEKADAKKFFDSQSVCQDDIEHLKIIESADLEIECNNMIQLMQNIKRKFTKKD